MQFGCDSCKAQLQIADEKVRGKRLIVRCKRCGAKIGIADPALGPPRSRPAPAGAGPQPRPAPSSVPAPARAAAPSAAPARRDSDTESTRAMDAGVLEQALQASKADDPSLAPAPAPEASAPPPAAPAGDGAVWFAMVHGKQEGPMNRAQLVARAAEGAVGPRTYLWRDGMEAWQRARELAELHDLFPQLPEAAPAPAVPAAAPEPPRASKPSPAAAAPEAPRASRPSAAARASPEPSALDLDLGPQEDRVPLDPMPLAEQVQRQGVADELFSSGPQPGGHKNAKDLASWATAELQKRSPRPRPSPRATPMFESAAREQSRLPLVMAAVVAVLGAAAVVLWMIFGSGSAAKPPETKPAAESGSRRPAAPPEKKPAGSEAKPREKAPEKPPEKAEAPPTIGLTADQVRKKLDENKGALQGCIDEALRRDPNLRVGKIHIATTIAPSGQVTAAKIDKNAVEQSPLGACLRRATRRIAFPQFSGEAFDVDIPIVVTAGE